MLTTILGYAGVFAVFTYIAPILIQISGFKEPAVSSILLLFGLGLMGGNLLGGKKDIFPIRCFIIELKITR
ncbi:MAG: MFS transporter [Proteobacteria bacterium]|nr:MFS transporter [Pseudomonadota bacterium]